MGIYESELTGKLKITILILFFVFVMGIVSGTIFYVKSCKTDKSINEEMKYSLDLLVKDGNEWTIAKNIFKENCIYALIIFISAFFRPGCLVSIFTILRKGFITGFFSASAVGTFGAGGISVPSTMLIDIVPTIMLFLVFSAISIMYSIGKIKNKKIFLIFFVIFLISIFCVLSLSRGFLTTRFMETIYPKII